MNKNIFLKINEERCKEKTVTKSSTFFYALIVGSIMIIVLDFFLPLHISASFYLIILLLTCYAILSLIDSRFKFSLPNEIEQFFHPEEWYYLLFFLYDSFNKKTYLYSEQIISEENDWNYCRNILGKVSRSFSIIIPQLRNDVLRNEIMVFYLILRGLDTIEDDLKYFENKLELQTNLLITFHETLNESYSNKNLEIYKNIGEDDEKNLLENYKSILRCFHKLSKNSKIIIKDIVQKMGKGMKLYLTKNGIQTMKEYNNYCYYVAGLVGNGLVRLFLENNLIPTENLEEMNDYLAIKENSLGGFLQKTNIIRDVYEDYLEGRLYYPQEIWKKYLKHEKDTFGHFFSPEYLEYSDNSIQMLNHMIMDALQYIPDILSSLRIIEDTEVFQFCAIPQVMAVHTLKKCYNNADVFRKKIKLRKGLTAKLLYTKNMIDVEKEFSYVLESIDSQRNR